MSKSSTRPVAKAVVITGVSSGIGYATAQVLIERGYRVFGSVRKPADGERVQRELGPSFTPLYFDVGDAAALPAAVAIVQAAVGENGLAGLVNNAGVAPSGPLMHTRIDDVRRAFEVNVFGLLAVTQAFLPLLGARANCPHAPGRIVNLSSISGGVAFPLITLYAMTKHAVEALSDGLRRELSIYGISVSAIEPGSIKTPIWDKSPHEQADGRYAATDYAAAMAAMPAFVANEMKTAKPIGVVTDAICHALDADRPKARYPLIGMWHLRKVIPVRLLDQITIRLAGLKRVA
ncbi:MAG: SDR family NAD(P)-dependent oxidoreductase [Pseudomonadota bacterium]